MVGLLAWGVLAIAGAALVGLGVGVVAAAAVAILTARKAEDLVVRAAGALPADAESHARYVNLVEGLCSATGVRRPRLYVTPDRALNALVSARGPRHSSIVVTTGLLEELSRIELEGVLARQLSEIKAGEALLGTVLAATAGRLPMVCDWALAGRARAAVPVGAGAGPPLPQEAPAPDGRRAGAPRGAAVVGWVLAGPAVLSAAILRRAWGTEGETGADLAAVAVTRYPPGLLAALEKIAASGWGVPRRHGIAHLWLQSPLAEAAPGDRLGFLDRALGGGNGLSQRIEALREL